MTEALVEKTPGKYIVTAIDMGCDCCSFVALDSFDSMDEVPAEWRGPNYIIEFEADCTHPDFSFSRTVCACGEMHSYCTECGRQEIECR